MEYMDTVAVWQEKVSDSELAEELAALVSAGDESALEDAFFQNLTFGTAGLRGVLGPGTNRMNIYTVAQATQGFANYLNATFDNPSVAIARDSRNKGELFEQVTAGVLAANGIHSHIYPRIEPTPALSFAVRHLSCSAGICMTASHNPAAYNGYKAYGPDGCQITSEAAAAIQTAIQQTDAFEDVSIMPFDQALSTGFASWIGEETLDSFIDAVALQSIEDPAAQSCPLKVVYTPLNGTGLECVTRILERIGVEEVVVVESQKDPDGNFPTCPYPNPEIREALTQGIKTCEQVHPDLLLATDPDADRVGIAVEDDGDYVLLTGNEVGILLLDYIARMRSEQGRMPDGAIAVSTIVSTVMIDDLAHEYGFSIKRVLTGFKYIGDVISKLEQEGSADKFIFGFEESYGYLSGDHVRDKDAINASMLICEMARYWAHNGLNLVQAMQSLYRKYGFYSNRTLSFAFEGAQGARTMERIMTELRSDAPSAFADYPVESVVDYKQGIDDLPKADVIEFRLPNTNKVLFRPSGTEPKIKAYLFAKGTTPEQAEATLDTLETAVREMVK